MNTQKSIDEIITPDEILKNAETLLQPPDSPGLFSAEELLNRKIENIPWLLDPLFPKVGLCAIAGSSDTGKSSFLRQFAISVCAGASDFLGFRLNLAHKRAIYLSSEDDDNAISFLLSKANKERQLPSGRFKNLTFIFDTQNVLLTIHDVLSTKPVDVVVIDCFSDLYGRSMNDTNQVRTFLNDYSQLAQKFKCLIIFLHHTGKRTDELAPSKHNLLGSQGFEAKMRLVIELRADVMEPDLRHLCIVKGNYLSKEYKTESYILKFNENLMFSNTGQRKPFTELTDNKPELKEQVRKLKSEGMQQ
jgi:hypothetical protein